jgi:ABC-type hemin transport system ATPase subunit
LSFAWRIGMQDVRCQRASCLSVAVLPLRAASSHLLCSLTLCCYDAAHKTTMAAAHHTRQRAHDMPVVLRCPVLQNHNMMLLDEPTNHLDIEAIDSLAEAIKNFKVGRAGWPSRY